MRTPTLIVTLLATLALAHPAGAGSLFLTDPAGDETVAILLEGSGCHDPAIDIVGLTVLSDSETVAVSLRLADLAGGMACAAPLGPATAILQLERSEGYYSVELRTPCEEILCTSGSSLRFDARLMGGAMDACAGVRVDGASSGRGALCPAEVQVDGSEITWTLPIAGTFEDSDGQTYAYDFRGVEVDAAAYTTSYFDAMFWPMVEDTASMYPDTFVL